MNASLTKAKVAKDDEFYTLMEDVEQELIHYKEFLEGKVVYCNCDNPDKSNFYKYLKAHFSEYKLRRLIASFYSPKPKISLFGVQEGYNPPYAVIYDENAERERERVVPLRGNGSYDSPECLNLLEESDVVVTNPPFSLFHRFIKLLIDKGKDFIVIGNKNALSLPYFFDLVKEGRIRMGVRRGGMGFIRPDGTLFKMGNTGFFTSFPIPYPKGLDLTATYRGHEEDYPEYLTLGGCIEVPSLNLIPKDYEGLMGVPLSIIDYYNPEQFELIIAGEKSDRRCLGAEFCRRYTEQGGTGHYTASTRKLAYYDKNGRACMSFQRSIIRNRRISHEESE